MIILIALAIFILASLLATLFLCYHAPFTNWTHQQNEISPNTNKH